MLTVYTYPIPKPANVLDVSGIPLDELIEDILAIVSHQKNIHIWFGYLDGWMLTPREEVLLRRAIRMFHCSLVTAFPFALSQAWKNEIDWVYTDRGNGCSCTNNDGRALQHGGQIGHNETSERPSFNRQDNQDRKTGSSQERRVKKRQSQTSSINKSSPS